MKVETVEHVWKYGQLRDGQLIIMDHLTKRNWPICWLSKSAYKASAESAGHALAHPILVKQQVRWHIIEEQIGDGGHHI